MSKVANTVVRVDGSDAALVHQFIESRFRELFGNVKPRPLGDGKYAYKGGSALKPYGFKAIVTSEVVGSQSSLITIAGRPKMNLMAYAALLVAAVLLIFGLSNPSDGLLGIIAAIVMIVASIVNQKSVTKQIQQVAADTQARFS